MHDRTANSRHRDSAIIGWISNTDVMTLGMILMFALSLFIQARFARGQVEQDGLRAESQSLQAAAAELAKVMEQLKKELREKQAELEGLKHFSGIEQLLRDATEKLRQADLGIKELEEELFRSRKDGKRINREMIGLRGDLKRTAILIDSSGSMKGQRWSDAVNVMSIWLDKLPVEEAALIVFSAQSRSLAIEGNTFTRLDGEEGEINRRTLIDQLKEITPEGGTYTRGALERAYALGGIDSIILFTDGAPNTGLESHFVRAEAEQIYKLIGEHKNIPINAIGVGQYFDKDLSEFLLNVGRLSEGTFIGR